MQNADLDYKKSVSTISITTCDSVKDSTQKFETPIYLQFSRSENGVNDQASDIQCTYYDTTYYRWLSIPTDTSTNGSNVVCQTDHLTYFSLLFRENDTNDDLVLTILDIIFTIISMVSSALAIYYYIDKHGFKDPPFRGVLVSVF